MSLTGQGKDEHRVCHCVTGWKECWTSLFLIHQLPSSYICGGCICLLLFLVVFPLDFSNSSLLSSFWGSEISSSKSYLHIWSFQLLEYQWSEGEFGKQTSSDPTWRSLLRQPQCPLLETHLYWALNLFFCSFLSITKQDQTLPNDGHGIHSTQF